MCALGVGQLRKSREVFRGRTLLGNEAKFLNYFQQTSNRLNHALTRTRSNEEQKDVLLV